MKTCLIIFSKNRPLQLDLCLSSIDKNVVGSKPDVYVLYKCDTEYKQSYKTLKSQHPSVHFWAQSNSIFKDVETILHLTSSQNTKYISFLTDDCIVYSQTGLFSNKILDQIFNCIHDSQNSIPMVSNLSLRLGLNINQREYIDENGERATTDDHLVYSNEQNIAHTNFGIIFYDRTQHFSGGYWNYPMSVDGHIYQIDEIFEYVKELAYLDNIKDWEQTPNSFESALQRFTSITKPIQAIYKESCVVNSPNNRVQNSIKNSNGHCFKISPNYCLNLFTDGKRINIDKIKFDKIRCPHTEINLLEAIE